MIEIRLNNNKLSTVPADAFAHCQELEIIYLHDNWINKILEGILDLTD